MKLFFKMYIGKEMLSLRQLKSNCIRSLFIPLPKKESNFQSKKFAIQTQILSDAEKIVGYPTSFLSLRWLLNDEVANIALHVRRLIGTDHPLLKTAREFLVGTQLPKWGLIVLLVSKAAGLKQNVNEIDKDITAGILHSQRVLAEVTEMVKTSNTIHKCLLNVDKIDINISDINFGNKLSLLTGDYLISTCFRELANVKNHDVNELISVCFRDLSEAEFIGPRDKQNRPLPAEPLATQNDGIEIPNHYDCEPFKHEGILGNAKPEWILRHILGGASLLAKGCQGTLMLANHSEEIQKSGYLLGRNIALAWQTRLDEDSFYSQDVYSPFSLINAPLMFHIQDDPSFYKNLTGDIENIDFSLIRREVLRGPGIEKTQQLQKEFINNAYDALEAFPSNDARTALKNIINAM